MTIQIPGVTKRQVQIMDELWKLDTEEDLKAYMRTKNKEDRRECITLRCLILLHVFDDMVDQMTRYEDSEKMLKKIGITKFSRYK